ncbi:MAG TPA: type IV pilin protein [Nevskiaceae bacterium]|nr:type IV pilin protein [Nevskiaceae bacterium]
MRNPGRRGFTLIELVVVIAVVGILASIAIPSYQNSVRKSRRQEAMATLVSLQLQQEKWRSNNSSYAASTSLSMPANTSFYTYTVDQVTATTYRLVATAAGSQTQDKQAGTSCSPLTLNQSATRSPEACWR